MGTTKTKKTTKAPRKSPRQMLTAMLRLAIENLEQRLLIPMHKLQTQQDGDRAELQRLIRLTEQHGRLFESGRASDNATVASLRRELTTVAARCATIKEVEGSNAWEVLARQRDRLQKLENDLTAQKIWGSERIAEDRQRLTAIESGLGGAQWKAQGQPARWITLLSTKHLENIIVGGWGKATEGPTRRAIEAELVRRRQDTTYRAAEQKVSPATPAENLEKAFQLGRMSRPDFTHGAIGPNTIEVDIDGVIHTNPKTIALRPDGKGNIHNPDLIVLEPKLATGGIVNPCTNVFPHNENDFGTVHIYSGTPSDPFAKCLMSYKLDKPPEFAAPKESILEEVARRRKAGEKCELRFGPDGKPVILNLETPQEEYARRTKAGENVALIWDPIAMKNGVQAVKPQKTEAERRLKEIMDERIARWECEQRNVLGAQRKEIDALKKKFGDDNMHILNTLNRVRFLESKLPPVGAIPTTPTATVQVDFATLGWRGRFCVALSALAGGEGVFRPKEVQS